MRKNNQRTFHRTLYSGELMTCTLLKRDDDLREGTVTAYVLFDCRQSWQSKSGQPIQGEMSSQEQCHWMIPGVELARVGVAYLNVLDRIVDIYGRFWQPESGQSINLRLFENYYFVFCVRVDPPTPPAPKVTTGADYQENVLGG